MEQVEYTQKDFNGDKVLIARLLSVGRYKNVREMIEAIHRLNSSQHIAQYVNGMLFVLDSAHLGK